MSRVFLAFALVALFLIGPTAAATSNVTEFSHAQATAEDQDWCKNVGEWNDRDEAVCEVRTLTEAAQSRLEGSVGNGSFSVTGTNRRDVSVQVRIVARASTREAAQDVARQVTVSIDGGQLSAKGPSNDGMFRRSNWHVSYRIEVPSSYNLDLQASNGAITITDVRGDINAQTANGAIRLTGLGGNVRARTSNGSAHATVSGSRWEGDGLSIVTSNGSARLDLPESINANLKVGTRNGSLNVDFPITVQGNLSGRARDIETTLGSGGPTLEVRTSNGSVRVGRTR